MKTVDPQPARRRRLRRRYRRSSDKSGSGLMKPLTGRDRAAKHKAKPATFKISSKEGRKRDEDARKKSLHTDGRARLRVLAVVFAALGVTIGVRLWYLQVLDAETFKEAAEQNQVRISRTQAPRGRMLGADGAVLVDNRMALKVGVELVQLRELTTDERDAMVERLAEIIDVPVEEINDRLEHPKVNPVDPIPVSDEVSVEQMAVIRERQEDFPGVVPLMVPVRVYPTPRDCAPVGTGGDDADAEAVAPAPANCSTLAAHVLGYVGETNDDDLEENDDYRLGDLIGRTGLESTYERHLRGESGQRKLEVDSRGRMLRVLGENKPLQGYDIALTLDSNIQRATERALEEGIMKARTKGMPAPAGAAVVLDPRDGGVRAMASFPTFDPAQFTGGIPSDVWDRLNDPANEYPLNNRVIQGLYPPASTWKPVTAMAALQHGFIGADDVLSTPASFKPGSRSRAFRDWKPGGHGSADFRKSLVWSVDVYYYKIGFEMDKAGTEVMQKTAREVGFERETGIDLPNERIGRVPDQNWKREVHNQNPDAFPDPTWYPGDSLNYSIGQGDLLVTPLQMANLYAAIANGGTLWRPHLLDKVLARDGAVAEAYAPQEIGRLPIDGELIARTQEALRGVATEGTARGTFAGFPHDEFPVGGKTGTGQVFGKEDMSWFVGFDADENSEFVVAVAIEQGGGGSATAGPVVRRIFESIYGIAGDDELQDAAPTD